MKIAVLGAGANGASIGADLIRAGRDVTLIEQWPAHVEAMRAEGLHIRVEGTEEISVRPRVLHLCEVAELRENFDVVLLLVKAYDTRWAAELIAPVLAPDGVLAAVQNGMSTHHAAAAVGAARTLGTVIEVSSTMTAPGRVERHSGPAASWFAVGALPGSGAEPHRDAVASALGCAGRVEIVEDIQATKWMKLVSNSTTLVTTALSGLSMLEALERPGLREIMLAAGDEALAVGRALGHPILPIFGLSPHDLARPDRVSATLLDVLYSGFVRPGATTTVLQDWRKGRRSEAEDLNGEVARQGAATGTPTPVNDAIVELARDVEAGRLSPGDAALERLRSLTRVIA